MMRLAVFAAGLALSVWPALAQAGPAEDADHARLAKLVTEGIAARLPAAATVLRLDPSPDVESRKLFTDAFTLALRRAGFALAWDAKVSPEAHPVSYAVTQLWDGYVVRITLDQTSMTRAYLHDRDGVLRAAGPLTIKEAPQQPDGLRDPSPQAPEGSRP
jgi:hypothetical protein